jgi:hypothetical protein
MAAGLGFKTFAVGEILSAANVNGYLMQGVLVFADAAARTAAITSPQEGQMSFLKDTNSTQYYSGSAWVAIGGAATPQTLSVQSNTQQTTTTSTYADITGHTLTITPASASSKFLIISTNTLFPSGAAADGGIRFLRGATNIFTSVPLIGATNAGGSFASVYLDSPATTSATTYQVQFNRLTGSGTVYSNPTGTSSNLVVMEIF